MLESELEREREREREHNAEMHSIVWSNKRI
jgi:hypothetical protein